jgi:hypothetical protein
MAVRKINSAITPPAIAVRLRTKASHMRWLWLMSLRMKTG